MGWKGKATRMSLDVRPEPFIVYMVMPLTETIKTWGEVEFAYIKVKTPLNADSE